MSVKRTQIGKGIDLNIIETDKFKTNFISLNFVTPLERETAGKNALLFRVLHRGSKKYPSVASLNEKLDYLYATTVGLRNYKRGEAQIVGLAAEMLGNEYTDDGTDLISEVADFIFEVVFDPLFDDKGDFAENYVEQEKEILINDIMAKINDKRRYASFRCYEEMCRGEAFGVSELGVAEDIEKITPRALREHYFDLISSAKIEIFFIGRCGDGLAEKLGKVFSLSKRENSVKIDTKLVSEVKEVKYVEEKLPVSQGKLSLGFRTGTTVSSPDYPALVMFNEVYGGSVASKLFMNVRERLSLCYYCSSAIESYKGTMIVNSGIEFEKRETAEREILDQLDAIRRGDISDYEYSSAKRSLKNAYKHMLDSPTSMEMYYLGRMMAGVYEKIEETAERFENISKEDIVNIANKIKLDTVYFMSGSEEADCE